MLPVCSLDYTVNRNYYDLQFTISDQLFLEMLLIEIRGKLYHMQHIKRRRKKKRFKVTTGTNNCNS